MQLTISRDTLLSALQSVSRATATRSTLPILSHVLIEAGEGALTFTATDLEIGLRTLTRAEVTAPGSVAVPGRILQDVVSNLPSGAITIAADENHLLTIAAAKSRYTIHGLPAEEYPTLPVVTGDELLLPAALVKDLVKKTIFAASTDEGRVILTGALLIWRDNTVALAATDTHRLALVTHAAPVCPSTSAITRILPARTLQEAARLCGNAETVCVTLGEAQVVFDIDGVRLVSRVIEGQFPAYERVIPQESNKSAVVNRADLLSAIKRASIVAREESNKLIFTVFQDGMAIAAQSGNIGRAQESLPITFQGEEAIEIAFNAEYLIDYLSVIAAETVTLQLTGPLNPGKLVADGEAGYTYVVMPMQVL